MPKPWTLQLYDDHGNVYDIKIVRTLMNELPESEIDMEEYKAQFEVLWTNLEVAPNEHLPASNIAQLCAKYKLIDNRIIGKFKEWLLAKGIEYKHTRKGNFYVGIKLKPQDDHGIL